MWNNMGKKLLIIIKIVFISILIIIGLVFLYFYIWFRTGINNLKKQHNKNIEIETQNREDNIKIFNEYIINTYGKVAEKFIIEIKPAVVNYDTNFIIQVEFMDKPFKVIVDTEKKKIYNDTFYKVLIKDMKFQHLYSNWVKKQVGIEDENVEFGFSKNTNATINFDRIDKLSKDYKEVFENTKGMELIQIFQYNIRDLSRENWYEYASNYLKYYNKIKSICNFNVLCDYNGFLLYLYKYEQDKNNVKDREEYYGTFDTPNNIDTTIINGIIYEDKAEFEQLEDEKIKKYVIDKNGNIIK